ncbi:hypothetical protein DFH28DRAFT_935856 [Melampsora americana]|nr:hypothetical protein DFH28DRAFT_935856 [Melampsora americana]
MDLRIQFQSTSSNNEALEPPQVTPPTINLEDDEDASKANNPNFVTNNEGSNEENDKTNNVSFESHASPTNETLDPVPDYFLADVVLWSSQKENNKPMYRKGKWCPKEYKIGIKGNWNLKGHLDGEVGRSECKNCHEAITAGAKLSQTWKTKQAAKDAKKEAKKYQHEKASLEAFLDVPKFLVGLFNMILSSKPSWFGLSRLRLLLPDDQLPAPRIVMADGTIVDEDGDLAADQDSDDKEDARADSGKDVEASDNSKDEDEAPNYREQQPDAALFPQAVTKVKNCASIS